MGLAGLIIAMAPTLGPSFGGLINYYWSWRDIFAVSAVFAILVFGLGLFVVGQYHQVQKPPFAWFGFICLSLSLFFLSLAVNEISRNQQLYFGIYLLLFGLLFIFFIYSGQKSDKKLSNLSVFRQRGFTSGLVAYFLLQFINIGISFVLPNYAQIVGRSTSLIAGFLLLPGSLLSGLLNPWFGRMYDHIGTRVIYFGSLLLTCSCLLFAIKGMTLSSCWIVLFYALLTLGHRMSFSNTMVQTLKTEPARLQSDATAICQTMQQLAGSFGTAIMAVFISMQQQNHGSYQTLTARGCQIDFMLAAILGLIIIGCDYLLFAGSKR